MTLTQEQNLATEIARAWGVVGLRIDQINKGDPSRIEDMNEHLKKAEELRKEFWQLLEVRCGI